MAGRRAPAGRSRGGEGIPTARPARTRLITGLGAAATLGGIAAYTWSGDGTLSTVGGVFGAGGAVGIAAAIALRFPAAVPWAVAFTGGGYVVGRAHERVVDGWAALVGAALLLAAELAAWSNDHDRRLHEERAVVVAQAVTVAALVACSALVGFVLVGAAAVSASAGLVLTALGITAAVAAVAVVLRLLRS